MKISSMIILISGLVFGLSACSNEATTSSSQRATPSASSSVSKTDPTKSETTPTSSPTASHPTSKQSRTEVTWSDYPQGTKSEIDQLTKANDCIGIESFYGMATATEEAIQAKYGHDNKALVQYIDEAISAASCSN